MQAVAGQEIRVGGNMAATAAIDIQPGKFVNLTANGTNGWDLDILASSLPSNSNAWGLDASYSNGVNNVSQTLPSGTTYTGINSSDITLTIPDGYSQNKVILNYTGWGHVAGTGNACGSFRYRVIQTGTQSKTYDNITMSSWCMVTGSIGTIRYNYPIVFSVSDLPPGTYTFALEVRREGENGTISSVLNWGIQSNGNVYVK